MAFRAKWIPVRVKKTHQNKKLGHDPEKCEAVFRKDHAQTTIQGAMVIQPNPIALWSAVLIQSEPEML
jgi:hypothetical protein